MNVTKFSEASNILDSVSDDDDMVNSPAHYNFAGVERLNGILTYSLMIKMILKVFLTLEIDEDEYQMPVDNFINDEVREALQEFIYDVDGMTIKSIRTVAE